MKHSTQSLILFQKSDDLPSHGFGVGVLPSAGMSRDRAAGRDECGFSHVNDAAGHGAAYGSARGTGAALGVEGPKGSAVFKAIAAALVALACIAFASTAATAPAYAEPTSADKKAEAEAVLANLNAMQVTLDNLSNEYGEALAAQEQAEASRDAAKARLAEINEQVDDLQTRMSAQARAMYRGGGISYLDTLLKANSFKEFAAGWTMLDKVNEATANMVETSKSLAAEEEQQAAIFDEQAAIASEKAAQAEQAAEQAQATMAEMQATYDNLSEEVAQLLEAERKAQQAEEASRAAAVLAEAAAAAEQERAGADQAASSSSAAAGDNSGLVAGGAPDASSGENGQSDATSTDFANDVSDTPMVTDDANAGSSDTGSSNTASEPDPVEEQAPAPAEEETPSVEEPAYEGGSDTVSRAYACLGAPYVWGGVGPGGYDCSGLVSYCLSGSHTRLGTTYTFMNWPRVSNPQPGDIAVNSGHTGVYIGDGQMIHAATYGVGVIVGPVQSGMIFVRYGG